MASGIAGVRLGAARGGTLVTAAAVVRLVTAVRLVGFVTFIT